MDNHSNYVIRGYSDKGAPRTMVIHGGYMDNHSNVTWQGDTVVISGGIV